MIYVSGFIQLVRHLSAQEYWESYFDLRRQYRFRFEGWYKNPPLRVEYMPLSLTPSGYVQRLVTVVDPDSLSPDMTWGDPIQYYECRVGRYELITNHSTGRRSWPVREVIDAGYCPELETWVVLREEERRDVN